MGRMGKGGDDSSKHSALAEEAGDSGRSGKNEAVAEQPGESVFQDEAGKSVNPDKITVHILVPIRDLVHGWFSYSLALVCGFMGKEHPYVDMHLLFNNGTILANQRQELAKLAMLHGADWTIWFDSDMRFPKDTIERLLAHRHPIVLAGYPTRKPPAIDSTVYLDDTTESKLFTEESSTGLQQVASGGFGCVAVHRSVYEAMEPPWFHIPWDEENMRYGCGEDVYFFRKAREAGFPVMLDHDLSKRIAHIGNYEFTYKDALAAREHLEELTPPRIKIAS